MFVEVCVGSSCHLKGSGKIAEMLQSSIEKYGLEAEIILSGSFCTGKCNRNGVTVTVDEEVFTEITTENFYEFFNDKILKKIKN